MLSEVLEQGKLRRRYFPFYVRKGGFSRKDKTVRCQYQQQACHSDVMPKNLSRADHVIYGLPLCCKRDSQLCGAGLRLYIRRRDGTLFVPSLDGCRAAAPLHPDGLMAQPMTRLRVCCCGGDPVRPSVDVPCYAILVTLFSVFFTPPRTFL